MLTKIRQDGVEFGLLKVGMVAQGLGKKRASEHFLTRTSQVLAVVAQPYPGVYIKRVHSQGKDYALISSCEVHF
jgi:hypothetical protein